MHLFSCWKKSPPEIYEPKSFIYGSTWRWLHEFSEFKRASPQEKLSFINFIMKVIGQDLQGHSAALGVYAKQNPYLIFEFFPVTDIYGEIPSTHDISLNGKYVINVPYDIKKLFRANKNILFEGFHRPKEETTGHFFPEMNLVFIVNGRHHAVAAQALEGDRAGVTVSAEVYYLSKIFPHLSVTEDKRFWMYKGKPLSPVKEVRIALLYELAKEADELKKEIAEHSREGDNE